MNPNAPLPAWSADARCAARCVAPWLLATHAWDASIAASAWARVLRDALEQAHGIGRP